MKIVTLTVVAIVTYTQHPEVKYRLCVENNWTTNISRRLLATNLTDLIERAKRYFIKVTLSARKIYVQYKIFRRGCHKPQQSTVLVNRQ